MKQNSVVRLTESALMIAFATVLSLVKLIELPYGGSITAASMLPILLIAYRYGTRWGLFTGLVHGLLQLFLGIKNIMGVSFGSVVAILLLDYLVAFAVLGFGGVFRPLFKRQSDALAAGALLGCALRYLCHVISGCTVWAEYNYTSLPTVAYSAVYNATYMLPETIVTLLAAVTVGSLLDLRAETITRLAPAGRRPDRAVLLDGIGKTLLAAALVFDLLAVCSRMQDPETGLFTFEALANAPWLWMLAATVAAAVLFFLFRRLAASVPDTDTVSLAWLFRLLPPVAAVLAILADGAYTVSLLQKAAEKAELAAPFSSPDAFFGACGALGVRYGLPVIAAGVCTVLLCVLLIRRAVRQRRA